MTTPTLAILGPGNVGTALGRRLAASGCSIVFGTRSGKDPGKLGGENMRVATPTDAAASADIVVLALPAGVVLEVARGLGDLAGKIVVDANNPLRIDRGPVWNPPPEGSMAQALQAALPQARVVKAWNTFGHEFHADPQTAVGPVSMPIAGDDAAAKATIAEIATRAGFAPIDAGPLRNAALLENLAILWIHLAMAGGQGRGIAWQLVGRG